MTLMSKGASGLTGKEKERRSVYRAVKKIIMLFKIHLFCKSHSLSGSVTGRQFRKPFLLLPRSQPDYTFQPPWHWVWPCEQCGWKWCAPLPILAQKPYMYGPMLILLPPLGVICWRQWNHRMEELWILFGGASPTDWKYPFWLLSEQEINFWLLRYHMS